MIATGPIDPATLLAEFTHRQAVAGAVVSFTGLVRGTGGVEALSLDHHPTFTEKVIAEIVAATRARFGIDELVIVHRVGTLAPGQPIVFVAAAAVHRRAAFEAVDYAMDRLKTDAPLWKREVSAAGAKWIDARATDIADRARWEDQNADR